MYNMHIIYYNIMYTVYRMSTFINVISIGVRMGHNTISDLCLYLYLIIIILCSRRS